MGRQIHKPVMAEEVRRLLAFDGPGWIVDSTVGLGGHAAALLESSPEAKLLGIDRDAQSLELARERLSRFADRVVLAHANFDSTASILKEHDIPTARSILLDLGLSSYQLADCDRGFSFNLPGPLDMRMDTTSGKSLSEILARIREENLAQAIWSYGEERKSRRIARHILAAFKAGHIKDTTELARVIAGCCGPRRRSEKIHPATRTFQALRLLVNRELESLESFLEVALELLGIGGRMAIITFHSLEDRIVKRWFALQAASCRCPPELPVCRCGGLSRMRLLARGEKPNEAELEANPRARSAKLRAGERLR